MTFEVLLAASDPVILRELIGQFPRGDWKPMAARSRAQVEAVIESRPLQVVVVHQSLDDISGLDFCRWIKEISGEGRSEWRKPDVQMHFTMQGR